MAVDLTVTPVVQGQAPVGVADAAAAHLQTITPLQDASDALMRQSHLIQMRRQRQCFWPLNLKISTAPRYMRFLNGSVTNVVVAQVVVKLIVTSALLAGYLGGLRLAAQSVRVLVELGFGRKRAGCHVRE